MPHIKQCRGTHLICTKTMIEANNYYVTKITFGLRCFIILENENGERDSPGLCTL